VAATPERLEPIVTASVKAISEVAEALSAQMQMEPRVPWQLQRRRQLVRLPVVGTATAKAAPGAASRPSPLRIKKWVSLLRVALHPRKQQQKGTMVKVPPKQPKPRQQQGVQKQGGIGAEWQASPLQRLQQRRPQQLHPQQQLRPPRSSLPRPLFWLKAAHLLLQRWQQKHLHQSLWQAQLSRSPQWYLCQCQSRRQHQQPLRQQQHQLPLLAQGGVNQEQPRHQSPKRQQLQNHNCRQQRQRLRQRLRLRQRQSLRQPLRQHQSLRQHLWQCQSLRQLPCRRQHLRQ